jgi:hypothetical protein
MEVTERERKMGLSEIAMFVRESRREREAREEGRGDLDGGQSQSLWREALGIAYNKTRARTTYNNPHRQCRARIL